jgi:hypothetical protein
VGAGAISPEAAPSMYLLATLSFLLHCAEEFPRFPAWATRHFGATSRPYYVYSHIPLIASVVTTSLLASTSPPGTVWPLLATAGQWVLFTNGLFHLVTTILFREYSPGVVTGTLLFFPATAYVLDRTVRGDLLTPAQIGLALALGTLAGALVIASLWLRMDLDWRLRRRPA